MLWPSSVLLSGVSIPLDGILSALTIHHGREDISDEPTATTCQLTLLDVPKELVTAFEVGQSLSVLVRDGAAPEVPRFSGHVTDATLLDDELTLIATGDLSRLRLYVIGETDWPIESWTARVLRAFTEAGLSSRLELHSDPVFNPQLAARITETAGTTTLGDYLTFLVGMVGAAVTDRPNGDFLVQAIGSRTLDNLYELEPGDVEFAPAWLEELPGGNIVTVRYTGDQSESVTVTDAASVALYGDRPETIDTSFVNAADATYRANQRLGRAAYAHWNIPSAPLVRGLELELGAALLLSEMPAASPQEPWSPILEGWTDDINGDEWKMTLSLSDPLLSGLTLPWITVPPVPSYHWDTIDPATDWSEALTLEDLLNA